MIFGDFEFWVLGISFEEIGKYDIKANLFFQISQPNDEKKAFS